MNALRGSLLMLLAAMIWGTAFVAQREGAAYLDAYTFNALRSLLGSAVLIPVVALFGRAGATATFSSRRGRRDLLVGGLVCGLLLTVASLFQQIGLEETSAGKAGFITTLYILIVPILGLCLGRRPAWTLWAGVALGLVGLFLLCVKEGFSITRGDMMVLRCAFTFSFHIMAIDFFVRRVDPILLSQVQFLVCGIACLIPIAVGAIPTPMFQAIYDCRWHILYMSVFSSGIAYTLQIVAQKRLDAGVAALVMSLESVFAALSGWIVLGETLSHREFLGCALVFAATIVAQLRTRKAR